MFYQVSTKNFVAGVETDKMGIIVKTAPILKKFKGQSITNLRHWIKKKKGQIAVITNENGE